MNQFIERMKTVKKLITIALSFFLLASLIPFSAYAEDFDHKAVFGDFEGYSYDKFDKEWSVYSIYSYVEPGSEFFMSFKSFGERGGNNLSATYFVVGLINKSKSEYININSIDILIGDDLYSYNNLQYNGGASSTYIAENGNLLIEALATCDPSTVSVRIRNDVGNVSLDLDAKQVEETLKRFCAVYVLNHVWDYEIESNKLALAQFEAGNPLYINGELADYKTMHKDIDYDELSRFLSELTEKNTASENNKNEVVASNPAPTENSIYVVGSVGDSYVELTGWKLQKDHDGKPILVLTYTWTNNSNDTAKASLAVSVEAYQNGVSLDTAYFIDGVDSGSGIKNVRPGYSIEVQNAYKLSDTKSDVEIEIKDLWDIFGSSTPIHTTIHLS